jgi:hypothetical protein
VALETRDAPHTAYRIRHTGVACSLRLRSWTLAGRACGAWVGVGARREAGLYICMGRATCNANAITGADPTRTREKREGHERHKHALGTNEALVRLEVWVPPPVGGAPSRHTGTGGAADGVHDQCLRDSGAGEPGVEWCPEASS